MEQSATIQNINQYYRLHSQIYDATRWMFLFGRKRLVRLLDQNLNKPEPVIAEVGCGTGYMLEWFRKQNSDARLLGIDPAEPMLDKTRNKFADDANISLLKGTFKSCSSDLPQPDTILFSYCLTMMEDLETVQENLNLAAEQLSDGGLIGIVDFHNTPFKWFEKWMKLNHVHLNERTFGTHNFRHSVNTINSSYQKAYMGWWDYQIYVGRVV